MKKISVFIFILSVLLIGQNLDKPFWGVHDWNGVRYGNIARNYLRYGLIETKFGQVENSGYVDKNKFEYYTHYPPLLPILISLSYRIFGISEWSTRLVPLIATSGIVVLIFLIGCFWNFKIGFLASGLSLVTPMARYFGKNPVHEPIVLFFILLSFWSYLQYKKNSQKKFHLLFLVGLIFAELTAWAGFFLIPAITIVLIIRKDKKGLKELVLAWLLTLSLFLTHFIHVLILTGSISGGNLFDSLIQRSGISSEVQPEGFNFLGYILRLKLWFSTLYTITLSLLALFWVVVRKMKIVNNDWPLFVLVAVGLIYLCLFSSSVFIHNYLIFYFMPFLALAGSATIFHFMNFKILNKFKWLLLVLFLILIFLERKNFVDVLNVSDTDKLAVEIGKAINKQTSARDTILVSPVKFSYSAEKFLKFYSDRKLIFADQGKLDYDYIVVVNQDQGRFQLSKK